MTDESIPHQSWHGDEYPARCCDHCESRKRESVALRARANLLRDALELHDEPAIVRHNAVQLLEMLWARGVC